MARPEIRDVQVGWHNDHGVQYPLYKTPAGEYYYLIQMAGTTRKRIVEVTRRAQQHIGPPVGR